MPIYHLTYLNSENFSAFMNLWVSYICTKSETVLDQEEEIKEKEHCQSICLYTIPILSTFCLGILSTEVNIVSKKEKTEKEFYQESINFI